MPDRRHRPTDLPVRNSCVSRMHSSGIGSWNGYILRRLNGQNQNVWSAALSKAKMKLVKADFPRPVCWSRELCGSKRGREEEVMKP
jgi:hypothetical protein